MLLRNPRPALHFLRRTPLGRGLAGRPAAFEILDKPRLLYVVLDDGPARPAVALVAPGHLPREVRRREVDELDAARVSTQSVVAPWPKVRNEEDRQKIIRVLLEAQGELFSLLSKRKNEEEEEKPAS